MDRCCGRSDGCVFANALLARAASCELSRRESLAERDLLVCSSAVARINCATLAALLHERARFALKLPPPARPLVHAQAMRLQCGGLAGLQACLDEPVPDVHRMVGQSQARHGSLTALPWERLVAAIVAWQPRQRGRHR